jgi:biotin transport system substrate-specific component
MPSHILSLPSSAKQTTGSILQILAASVWIALCARITIPLFFTPIPFSLQVFAILLLGAFLGPRKSAAAVLAYLAEGTLGLPVLISPLGGPTTGYLIGFILQAYLAGLFLQTWNLSKGKTIAGLVMSCGLQLLMGTLWLKMLYFPWGKAFYCGFYPFLLTEPLKVLIAVSFLSLLFPWKERWKS